MGSLRATCEIVEVPDERNSSNYSSGSHQVKPHDKEKTPHSLKQGYSTSLEEDINKLFEAVHRKTSMNGLSLSDEIGVGPSRKNALKKPMRMSTSSSSGIGFSEPVSLKQALRGLCISQASEMAAMKRLSKTPGSPAVSESGRIANLRNSGNFEASGSGASMDEVNVGRFEVSFAPEESTSCTSGKMPQEMQEPKMKSYNSSTQSSPRLIVETRSKRTGFSPRQNELVPSSTECANQPSIVVPVQKEKNILITSPPCNTTAEDAIKSVEEILSSAKLVDNRDNQSPKPSKLVKKSPPKLRRKGRFQGATSSSSSSNSINLSKSARNAPRAVIRNKNIVKKKSKQDSASAPRTFKVSSEFKAAVEPDKSQMICHRCQCHLKDARQESSKDSLAPPSTNINSEGSFVSSKNGSTNQGFAQSGCDRNSPVAISNNKNSKCVDKGEFTQSSKSSIGDYSSSTSISEESNLSVCSVGNRPHMSKDTRWQAVHHVMKQNGFLGLRHFNLLKKLGCGDIGTVYLAELIGTNCPFAIKVMDNEFLERRKKMPRAQTEREILRILDHPFLPTLYAHFVSDNLSCLVMEYCPGGDLHVLRQKQPGRFFHEHAARFYVAEVLLALEYLHMLGIVYRDLKPENILVREDGHIMLTDFDLSLRCSVNPTLMQSPSLAMEPARMSMEPARMSGPCAGSNCIDPFCIKPTCQVSCFTPRLLLASKAKKSKADMASHVRSLPQLVAEPTEARSNSFVGTHEYLAPEIIKGDGHGSAVDWWTFGIFLYELLYGKTPFKGSGNEDTLSNVVLHSLKFPEMPLVSLQARDLIKGLLVKDPENRLGSQRGSAEIKQHPFFDGLNWALIRCEVPPELPEPYEAGVSKLASLEKGKKYLECGGPTGGQLEFELF